MPPIDETATEAWSLEHQPAVPAPAPPNSKEPASPADYPVITMDFPIAEGPFEPSWESIKAQYPGVPAWLREAKFGIFIHWGPQAFGRSGDWYGRKLYMEGSEPYQNHLKNFGHPSEFGYKDVLNAWNPTRWDPARLTEAFYQAGARFMMAVGVHHDNFDLWNSTNQPWNAVNIGPKRDMIGEWQAEAKQRGMQFGITFHHEYTWWWWQTAFCSDTQGEKAGVPYDAHLEKADGIGRWWEGLDPRLLYTVDLREYRDVANIPWGREGIFQDHLAYGRWYAEWWARRIIDAIEQYDPDFIYTDGNGTGPFCGHESGSGLKADAAQRMVAHYYNRALARHGAADTLAFIKWVPDNPAIGITKEVEVPETIITDKPWIGENPIGDWYYGPDYCYDAVNLVRSLLEYASRDGSYACAVPITPEGDLEPACWQMLADMGAWMAINGEGIYGSRAWQVWGEGEPVGDQPGPRVQAGALNAETAAIPFTEHDFRFTVGKDGALYAWCMTVPHAGASLTITSLGTDAGLLERPITGVSLLGSAAPLDWQHTPEGLVITCPCEMPFRYAVGFKVVCG